MVHFPVRNKLFWSPKLLDMLVGLLKKTPTAFDEMKMDGNIPKCP